MKHSKKTKGTIPLKFELDTFVRLPVRSNQHGKMSLCWFHTSHHDNKLSNTKTISYIVWIGIMNIIQKSLFQLIKILKMNIIKHSTKKYRTNES